MNNLDNDNILVNIILEHTKLVKEHSMIPANGGDTIEEAEKIATRKKEIVERIRELTKIRIKLYGK